MNTTASPEVLRNRLVDTIVRERVAGLYDPLVEDAPATSSSRPSASRPRTPTRP
ncbi:hypothetical protein [Streptomyces wuyuanensis]|uniref:hypothetical protein n=1 Tax=Streptomyces wuyuanensis TaxID=1196353 RepID=UPI003802D652